jgi:alpha-glucosidase
MGVNENYKTINVENQWNDPVSVLSFYRDMINLRKAEDVFVYGAYDLILEEDTKVYGYTRTLGEKVAVVLSNLSGEDAVIDLNTLNVSSNELRLQNYEVEEHNDASAMTLKPYETRVYVLNK